MARARGRPGTTARDARPDGSREGQQGDLDESFEIQRPSNKPPPPTPDVNSNEPWLLVEPDARSRRILSVRTKSSIHTFHLALTFGDPLPSGSWKPNFRGTRGLVRQRANHDDIELVSTSSACGNFFAAHMLRAYPPGVRARTALEYSDFRTLLSSESDREGSNQQALSSFKDGTPLSVIVDV